MPIIFAPNPIVIEPITTGDSFPGLFKISKIVWTDPDGDIVIGDRVLLTRLDGTPLYERRINSFGPGIANGQLVMPEESIFNPPYVCDGIRVALCTHGRLFVFQNQSNVFGS